MRLVLVLAALLLAGSLFLRWTEPGNALVLFGALDQIEEDTAALRRTGWEQLELLDVLLVALAALLAAAAVLRRDDRRELAALVLLCLVAGGGVVVEGFLADRGGATLAVGAVSAEVAPAGPILALASLALAILALGGLIRRRGRTTL